MSLNLSLGPAISQIEYILAHSLASAFFLFAHHNAAMHYDVEAL